MSISINTIINIIIIINNNIVYTYDTIMLQLDKTKIISMIL